MSVMDSFTEYGKISIVIDGGFGSSGKGLLSGYLAKRCKVDLAMTNASPNAGHTFIDHHREIKVYHLPVSGVIHKDARIYIGPGAIVDPDVLEKECREYDVRRERLWVDPRAAIVKPENRNDERRHSSSTTRLASTQKGVGEALVDKIRRDPSYVSIARQSDFLQTIAQVDRIDVNKELSYGTRAILEVPQGLDLGINSSMDWPHCTSREISVAQALSDVLAHPHDLGKVAMAMRTFPIRVGHIYSESGVKVGDSGPFWPDSVEVQWDYVGVEPELTTVTKRPRRIATFSEQQYYHSLYQIRPDIVFMNFMNYIPSAEQFGFARNMEAIERRIGWQGLHLWGNGPKESDIVSDAD